MRGHAAPALFLDAATAWRNAGGDKKQENGEARLAHPSRLLCFFSEMAETEAVAACDMFLVASLREQGRTWRASESDARAAFTTKMTQISGIAAECPSASYFVLAPPKKKEIPVSVPLIPTATSMDSVKCPGFLIPNLTDLLLFLNLFLYV